MSDKQGIKPKYGLVIPREDQFCTGTFGYGEKRCALGWVTEARWGAPDAKKCDDAQRIRIYEWQTKLRAAYTEKYGTTIFKDNDNLGFWRRLTLKRGTIVRRLIELSDDLIELPRPEGE